MILDKIGRKKFSLIITTKNILDRTLHKLNVFCFFDTFIKYEKDISYILLYNQILIFQYLNDSYFIYNKNNAKIITNHCQIVNGFFSLNQKTNKIFLLCINGDSIFLKENELDKHKTKLKTYTKISSTNINFNERYNYNSIYEFNFRHFMLFFKSKLILFEKYDKVSIIIQNVDISFSNMPILINFRGEELILKSSGNYFYKLTLTNHVNPMYTILNEVTLNFNNDKYFDLIETLKLIIFYNCEILKHNFCDLKKIIVDIFHSNNIFSYVENLEQILSEENINFFLFHNIENHKFKTIIIFSLIHEKHNFFNKILSLVLKSKTICHDQDEEFINFNQNHTYQYLIIYIIEIIFEVFQKVANVNLKSLLEEFFIKIIQRSLILEESFKHISYYLDEKFNKGRNNEENYSKILQLILD